MLSTFCLKRIWTPAPGDPHALSGTVSGSTRSPGDRFGAQGSVSSRQARVTLDGPLGNSGAGYLLSLRTGLTRLASRTEPSYLRPQTADMITTLETPALGGRLQMLGYASSDELAALASPATDSAGGPETPFHHFEWDSRSVGATWTRGAGRLQFTLRGWNAQGSASATWVDSAGLIQLTSERHDHAVQAAIERHATGGGSTTFGIRLEHIQTSYRIGADSVAGPPLALASDIAVPTGFAEQEVPVGARWTLRLGTSVAVVRHASYQSPHLLLRWRPSDQLAFSGSYSRTHQFAQSLQDAESVVKSIFPIDLPIAVGASGVPVARSDQGVVAVELSPWPGVRVVTQAYYREFGGLVLVAPKEGGPFAMRGFATGSGNASGVSVDASIGSARYGVVVSYGFQHTRLRSDTLRYIPGYGTTHLFEGGVIIFPSATFSLRLGVDGAFGRRATTVANGYFDWEACNLSDRGCEFGGRPRHASSPLSDARLPAYARVDLGARKHWHVRLGQRDATIALYGSITNLFYRVNVLTYAKDPVSGTISPIEMRPRSPLVLGLDWRF